MGVRFISLGLRGYEREGQDENSGDEQQLCMTSTTKSFKLKSFSSTFFAFVRSQLFSLQILVHKGTKNLDENQFK